LIIVSVTDFSRLLGAISMHHDDVDHVGISGLRPRNEHGHMSTRWVLQQTLQVANQVGFVAVRAASGFVWGERVVQLDYIFVRYAFPLPWCLEWFCKWGWFGSSSRASNLQMSTVAWNQIGGNGKVIWNIGDLFQITITRQTGANNFWRIWWPNNSSMSFSDLEMICAQLPFYMGTVRHG
jgi:hypothetical protein